MENMDENSLKIWKIWKNEMIWKISKKSRLNCEKISKVWKKNKLYGITGYLTLPLHFFFIITIFISIITFLTKVCHHFIFQKEETTIE
jgi:hypothetical protein